MLWTPSQQYRPHPYESEAELEAAVVEVAAALFGDGRIYLDVKRRIGARGKIKNIPDGYLLDLTSRKEPRLFVVENELASHEPLNHIAVQILQFSMSFESSTVKVKAILKEALRADKTAWKTCEAYAENNDFDNVDHLLDAVLNRAGAFSALVIIDELEEELETALRSRFNFPVEVLTLERYRSADGQKAYHFNPFLADLDESEIPAKKRGISVDPADIDTIVIPAHEEGFEETFIGENRWYQIRIHASMLPKIKYIAAYRVNPESAITHVAQVKDIKRWKNTRKYVLNFTEPAKKIGPIRLVPHGTVKAPQGPRYTSLQKLKAAKTLDQAF